MLAPGVFDQLCHSRVHSGSMTWRTPTWKAAAGETECVLPLPLRIHTGQLGLRIAPMRILSALNPIRNTLGHHANRRIGIGTDDIGQDGGIDHA